MKTLFFSFFVAAGAAFGCVDVGDLFTSGAGGAGGAGGADGGKGGGASAQGGQGGSGAGGAGSGQGGGGGATGCVDEPYVCNPLDCGLVANDCGVYANCNAGPGGALITCEADGGASTSDGPSTCNPETHRCECMPGPESHEYCEELALPAVAAWCSQWGGCQSAYCGDPPVAKLTDNCTPAGYAVTSGADPSKMLEVWCCAKRCDVDWECDDGNECTGDSCGADGFCAFQAGPQKPCGGGTGLCLDGECTAI